MEQGNSSVDKEGSVGVRQPLSSNRAVAGGLCRAVSECCPLEEGLRTPPERPGMFKAQEDRALGFPTSHSTDELICAYFVPGTVFYWNYHPRIYRKSVQASL